MWRHTPDWSGVAKAVPFGRESSAKAQDLNILFEAIHIDDKVCEPVSTYDKADRILGSYNDKGIVNRTFFVHIEAQYCILTHN